MPTAANSLRVVFILFAAGVWGLTYAALDGRSDETAAAMLALLGAALLISRGGGWIAMGVGASLASTSALTIGSASATLATLVNVTGLLLVMGAGLRVALELQRKGDAAARPVVIGVVGLIVSDYALVHGTATGTISAFAVVLPAAALLPLAYGAWGALLKPAAAPARVQAPEHGMADARVTA
jgi:hypothetical protein